MRNERKMVEERIISLRPMMEAKGYSLEYQEKADNNEVKHGINVLPMGLTDKWKLGVVLYYEPSWSEKSDKELADILLEVAENIPDLELGVFAEKDFILAKVKPLIYEISNLEEFRKTELFHKETEEFLILFYVPFDNGLLIKISRSYMEKLGISEDELIKSAFENLRADLKIFTSRLGDVGGEIPIPPMYVITNRRAHLGAAGILLPDTYKILSEKLGEEFIILPSSIHECMAIPYSEEQDRLVEMVKEINKTIVCPTERLSDHIYLCTQKGVSLLK